MTSSLLVSDSMNLAATVAVSTEMKPIPSSMTTIPCKLLEG
jgi:hypothetical protein